MLARLPSGAGCSARMKAVTACPTIGPSSENSARISPDRLPASRGRTLKVSMAFATVGLDSARRAAIWLDESDTRVLLGLVCAKQGKSGSRLHPSLPRLLTLLRQSSFRNVLQDWQQFAGQGEPFLDLQSRHLTRDIVHCSMPATPQSV